MKTKFVYHSTVYFTEKANAMINRMAADALIKTSKLDKSKLICDSIEEKYFNTYGKHEI